MKKLVNMIVGIAVLLMVFVVVDSAVAGVWEFHSYEEGSYRECTRYELPPAPEYYCWATSEDPETWYPDGVTSWNLTVDNFYTKSEIANITSTQVYFNGELTNLLVHSIDGGNYISVERFARVLDVDAILGGFTDEGQEYSMSFFFGKPNSHTPGVVTNTISPITAEYTVKTVYLGMTFGAGRYISGYVINGEIFFTVRDLCQFLNYGIAWNPDTRNIYVDTQVWYNPTAVVADLNPVSEVGTNVASVGRPNSKTYWVNPHALQNADEVSIRSIEIVGDTARVEYCIGVFSENMYRRCAAEALNGNEVPVITNMGNPYVDLEIGGLGLDFVIGDTKTWKNSQNIQVSRYTKYYMSCNLDDLEVGSYTYGTADVPVTFLGEYDLSYGMNWQSILITDDYGHPLSFPRKL